MNKTKCLSNVVVAARSADRAGLVAGAVAMLGYGVRSVGCVSELERLVQAAPCLGIILDASLPRSASSRPSVLTVMRFMDGLARSDRPRPPVIVMIDGQGAGGEVAMMRWAGWMGLRGVVDFMVAPTAGMPWTADPERVLRLAMYLPRLPSATGGLAASLGRTRQPWTVDVGEMDRLQDEAWQFYDEARRAQDPVLQRSYEDAWRDCQLRAMGIAGRLVKQLRPGHMTA